ncbi:hypothetical protein ALC62_09704 [Cyphomyrmex costatus]|uniref:Uncharacterized protein n=1 Tax=Cyphomyrmex costatus TaxID=456900 RepID=A0A151IF50_9HYME|nr:hypothetical protein ALC62_09704 [Cyphomyrmex costatus]
MPMLRSGSRILVEGRNSLSFVVDCLYFIQKLQFFCVRE